MAPNSPYSWTPWLQDLGSHTAAWVWVVSQKGWRNQPACWIQAMHQYSIWGENAFSRFSVLPGSAQAQVNRCGIVKRILIVYFIGSICAKKYQNPFTNVKVIANQRWDVFETRCRCHILLLRLWQYIRHAGVQWRLALTDPGFNDGGFLVVRSYKRAMAECGSTIADPGAYMYIRGENLVWYSRKMGANGASVYPPFQLLDPSQ